ncbi:MAG: extracellular solute-binding protein, partial [Cyanobacteria bacterium J06632_22]
MKRRTLLLATTSAVTTATLGGACNRTPKPQLDVRFLEPSLPLRIIKVFRNEQQAQPTPKLTFEADSQLAGLFKTLQTWQSNQQPQPPLWRRWLPNQPQPQPPDLFTLGDSWLQAAIAQQLIQPLPITELAGWQQLPTAWQQLVRRNAAGELDDTGQIWAAPYRTQPLVMAYSERAVSALGRAPQAWADLWDPALQNRIALPQSPRLIMALTLKKRGESVNAANRFSSAQTDLKQLLPHTQVFDSSTSLTALINEDVWVAVGWSGDVLST